MKNSPFLVFAAFIACVVLTGCMGSFSGGANASHGPKQGAYFGTLPPLSRAAVPASEAVGGAPTLAPGSLILAAGQTYAAGSLNLVLRADGELVLYDVETTTVLWSSQTSGHSCQSGCAANFQADGNLVLSENGAAYWTSGTAGATEAVLALSAQSPYLSIQMNNQVLWSLDR